MITCDAIVVGGGPAGSSCARLLRLAGWEVVVVDRARFPRDKVCAGWLTPDVFPLLDLTPSEYRASGSVLQEITGFRTRAIGGPAVETRYGRTISYAIRRCEFDDVLLRRAGARVIQETSVSSIRRADDVWVVDDMVRAPVLVGAGGHFCPVARFLRAGPEQRVPVVAREAEFPLPGGFAPAAVDPELPDLLFCRDLRGYAWCVRKQGFVNVGIGRRGNQDFKNHLAHFAQLLETVMGVHVPANVPWRGHAYLASGTGPRPLLGDGVLLAGDAAGVAYPESGEGIKPAIESGTLAARTLIDARGRFSAEALQEYGDALSRRFPARPDPSPVMATISASVGRGLLRSSWFTRHVVMDRWFLRTSHQGSPGA